MTEIQQRFFDQLNKLGTGERAALRREAGIPIQQADGAVPLPNDGSATLLIMGNGRWSYDADTGAFSGRYTSGGTAYTCTLGLEVNGAEISQA